MLKKIKGVVTSVPAQASTLVLTGVVAAQSYAIDTTDIESAYTAGGTAVGSAVSGLIGLVAGVVGATIVISLLKKA